VIAMPKPPKLPDHVVEARARYRYCNDCRHWLCKPGQHKGPCGHPKVQCYPATTDGINTCVYDPPLWEVDHRKPWKGGTI